MEAKNIDEKWNVHERAAYEVGVRDGLRKAAFTARATGAVVSAALPNDDAGAAIESALKGLATALEEEAKS